MSDNETITIRHMDGDQGPCTHLICRGGGSPDGWVVTLTPRPEEDPVAVLRAVLAEDWASRSRAYDLPAWDPVNAVIHVGTTVEGDGFVADVARTFNPGEVPQGLTRSEIVEAVREAIRNAPNTVLADS